MNWDWDKLKEQQQQRTPISPQVDELIEKMKQLHLPGGFFLVAAAVVLLLLFTCVFTIAVDEVGVIQRFGKYTRTCQPGLNFKLPMGIDRVRKLPVQRVLKKEFGDNQADAEGASRYRTSSDAPTASLMLTGDLNVGQVPWIVQYQIKDPYNYLFKVENVDTLLNDMSEAAMQIVVGDRSINEVISKRDEIATEAREVLQKELDNADAGILVRTIEMKRTNVPEPVQPSFNEVNQATQEKETLIYQAKEDYNKAVPEARGEAERTLRAAEGYALERVNQAKGDATRFTALYQEYTKAPDVTKRRMYLETMERSCPKLGPKYIIDSDQKNLLPFLNLGNEISKQNGDQK